ncbi:MAG: exodeoxyribonuclease I [Gammaproteobacteria bacterium]
MAPKNSLYWYDLETFGTDSKRDRISQFAGVRTDEDLNVIDEPLTLYCQLSEEILPEPISCLVTGITPKVVNEKGMQEHAFIKRIFQEFSQPNTCVVGYNNIRFDDEFMRYAFFRNFHDPYEREWRNGNSRWDIVDMVRLTHALRPDGIQWPKNEDGNTSFRLELLTQANNIEHSLAHDAMSDVYATIAMARLIKEKQGKLYEYVYNNRNKRTISQLLNVRSMTPVVHISSRYTAAKSCMAVVAPLAMHPVNKNAYIVCDLSVDPNDLIELNVEQIKKRLFTPSDQMPDNVDRIPLKAVHVNKCPVIVPLNTLDSQSARRLGISLDKCYKNLQTLKQAHHVMDKIRKVFSHPEYEQETDPEFRLYDGFANDKDKQLMQQVREASPEQLRNGNYIFEDQRLAELLIRYKARNFPDTLTDGEQLQWEEYQHHRLFGDNGSHSLTIPMLRDKLVEIQNDPALYPERRYVLDELAEYTEYLQSKYATLAN